MKILLAVLVATFMATTAWAGIPGMPNEAANPGFELTTGWTISGPVSQRIAYSTLTPYGVPKCPDNPGNYCGGIAAANTSFPGGELYQIVDESQFFGWDPLGTKKMIEVDFWLYQKSLADVPMTLNVYLDWMMGLSYPNPQSPLYVKQRIGQYISYDSGGWKFKRIELTLPIQPRWLSLHFEFTYFSGTAINIIDNVVLNGKCIDPVPEPASLTVLGLGLLALLRRRR